MGERVPQEAGVRFGAPACPIALAVTQHPLGHRIGFIATDSRERFQGAPEACRRLPVHLFENLIVLFTKGEKRFSWFHFPVPNCFFPVFAQLFQFQFVFNAAGLRTAIEERLRIPPVVIGCVEQLLCDVYELVERGQTFLVKPGTPSLLSAVEQFFWSIRPQRLDQIDTVFVRYPALPFSPVRNAPDNPVCVLPSQAFHDFSRHHHTTSHDSEAKLVIDSNRIFAIHAPS